MKNLKRIVSIALILSIVVTSNAFFTFADGINNETTIAISTENVDNETTTIQFTEEESADEEETSLSIDTKEEQEVEKEKESEEPEESTADESEETTSTFDDQTTNVNESSELDIIFESSENEKDTITVSDSEETTNMQIVAEEGVVASTSEFEKEDIKDDDNLASEKNDIATISDLIEIVATQSQIDSLYGSGDPWMWWRLDPHDSTKIVFYSYNKASTTPINATGDEEIDYGTSLTKNNIKTAVFSDDGGAINAKSCKSLFRYFHYLETIEGLENFNTSTVENFSYMFQACWYLQTLDLSDLDTRSATDMSYMFSHCSASPTPRGLTNITFGINFVTTNVTNMSYMFDACDYLGSVEGNDLDLSGFDTRNVTNMSYMFRDCSRLKKLDLSSFDTRNIQYTTAMFRRCSRLVTIQVSDDFVVSQAVIDSGNTEDMFESCNAIKGGSGTSYSSGITNGRRAHIDCEPSKSNRGYLTGPKRWVYFYLDSSDNQIMHLRNNHTDVTTPVTYPLGEVTYGNVVKANITKFVFDNYVDVGNGKDLFKDFTNLSEIDNIENFNVAQAKDIKGLFQNCSSLVTLDLSNLTTLYVEDMSDVFNGCTGLKYVNLNNWNTSNVLTMLNMFYDCSQLLVLDINSFDTNRVIYYDYMFYGCSNLKKIVASNTFIVNGFSSSNHMFEGCSSIEGGKGTRYTDASWGGSSARIDGGPTSSSKGFFTDWLDVFMWWRLEDANLTIHYTDKFEIGSSLIASASVINYVGLNDGVRHSITKAVFDNYITITSANKLFYNFFALNTIESFDKLDTAQITDMSHMFDTCTSLPTLDLSNNFITSNVTDMSYMFNNCSSLQSLTLDSDFDTSHVTNMEYMFNNCVELQALTFTDNFDTGKVTNMRNMFRNCSNANFTRLDLSFFKTSRVTDMSYMFEDCTSLVTIIVSEDFDVTNVTNSTDMFNNCTSIVGDNDTTYDNAHVDKVYARIDGGPDSTTPGYFTYTPKVYLLKYMKNLPTDYELLDEDDWYDPSSSVNPSSNPIRVSGTAEGMICKSTSTSEIRVLEKWNTEADGSGTDYNFGSNINTTTPFDINKKLKIYAVWSEPRTVDSWMYWYATDDTVLHLTSIPGIGRRRINVTTPYGYIEWQGLSQSDVTKVVVDNPISIQTCAEMFYNFENMKSIEGLNLFDTSATAFMKEMFFNCHELENLDLSSFDTQLVQTMERMFTNCQKLKKIIVSDSFTTASLTDGGNNMFQYCIAIKGGNGTIYDSANVRATYAHIDIGSNPGYFTSAPVVIYSIESIDNPTKTTYMAGTNFDPTGLVLHIKKTETSAVSDIPYSDHLYDGLFTFEPSLTTPIPSGTSNIKVTYGEEDYEIPITTLRNPTSITVRDTAASLHTYYIEGDTIPATSLTGLEFTANYSTLPVTETFMYDERSEFITTNPVVDTPLAVNNDKLVFSYGGANYNFPIVVEPNENPTSIELVHTADMDIYANGETFLPIGIIIKANYNGGISRNVEYVGETETRFEFNPELTTPLTTTDISVDLTYRSISGITIPITVTAAITSISLSNPPDITEYSYGDKFNPSGIKILVNYDDTTSNEVAYNDYKNYFSFNPSLDTPFAQSTVGTSQNVTITYKVHDTNFTTDPILGNMIYFYYYDNATNKNVHRHDTVDTYVNQAASSGATGFFFFNADGYNDGLSKYNRNTVGTMTKAQALDYINNYDPTIEGRKFMGASYYKPSPGPSPTPVPSGGGSSGGGGGSGVGPMTNTINSKTILKNKTYKLPLDASVIRWEYKPMEDAWGLNVLMNDILVPLKDDFYYIKIDKKTIVNDNETIVSVIETYYLDENGKMFTGWLHTLDGNVYFFDITKNANEGKMAVGWKLINGNWYYFDLNGAMLVNTITPDGYLVGADGKML